MNTMEEPFYWQTARDSLLTTSGLNMFQIALKHVGEEFDKAKSLIDREYEQAKGRSESERNGGNFQTYIRVFEEAGLLYLEKTNKGDIIQITPAGEQAAQLLIAVPDFFKAVPYFLMELLSRFQLNNPSGPKTIKNSAIKDATAKSNIFPYFTIWKIMRKNENYITSDELKRFVFRIQRSEEVESVVKQIKDFRRDKDINLTEEELNQKYPSPIVGAKGEPKYIMGRAGTHIGNHPPLIQKPNGTTYQLNEVYLPLVDEILSNEPVFQEVIDSNTWFKDYGEAVSIEEEYIEFSISPSAPEAVLSYEIIEETDSVWRQVKGLLDMGARNILFVGPPGTSKTTYALAIGSRLVNRDPKKFHNIQLHQSYSYEDFIQGYVPSKNSTSQNSFSLEDKVFLRVCAEAHRDETKDFHVLIIDEINRADPSRVFGEAMTYIERRDETFELPYSRRRVLVPSNLIILSTMNPFDKSISDLDQAMDRRFEKIEMNPNSKILRTILTKNNVDPALLGKLIGFFSKLSIEVEDRIGHAYFKDVRDLDSLLAVWKHKVLPLLNKELKFEKEKLKGILTVFNNTFSSSQ